MMGPYYGKHAVSWSCFVKTIDFTLQTIIIWHAVQKCRSYAYGIASWCQGYGRTAKCEIKLGTREKKCFNQDVM